MQELFAGDVWGPTANQPVTVQLGAPGSFLVYNGTTSNTRLHFGPDHASAVHLPPLDPGESATLWYCREPSLALFAPFGLAKAAVWRIDGAIMYSPATRIGTTFKGGPRTVLETAPTKLLSAVIGTDRITFAQDPRNHPDAVVWITTNAEPGVDKRFPLLRGQYLELRDFNSGLFAWHESPEHVGEVALFFAKHASGMGF